VNCHHETIQVLAIFAWIYVEPEKVAAFQLNSIRTFDRSKRISQAYHPRSLTPDPSVAHSTGRPEPFPEKPQSQTFGWDLTSIAIQDWMGHRSQDVFQAKLPVTRSESAQTPSSCQ